MIQTYHDFTSTFLDNKYTRWYLSIITKALQENRKRFRRGSKNFRYFEHHHIIPKSIKPEFKNLKDHPWNGVLLTPKEHFVCHLLLTKMLSGESKNKMTYALWGMTNQSNSVQERFHSNLYERYKEKVQEALSHERKGKTLAERFGKERADQIKEKFKTRKHRSSPDAVERAAISKRFSEAWKNNKNPRGFQVKQLEKIICTNCNRAVDPGNYSRHHGEKCTRVNKVCPTCKSSFQTTRWENKTYCCRRCALSRKICK